MYALIWDTYIHQNHMMMTLGPVESHDIKSQVASYFNELDLECYVIENTVIVLWHQHQCQLASHGQKSHAAAHFGHLDLRIAMVPPIDTISIIWCWHWYKWQHMTKNVILHLILIILRKQRQWWYWWCHWWHMMLMLVSVASHDQNSHFVSNFDHCNATNKMLVLMIPVSRTSHGQKCYVAHCFSHLGLMNTVVFLTMPLTSNDADASINSVKWLENSCCTSFQSSWPNKCNTGITWVKISCCTSFQSSETNKQKGVIGNSISVMLCKQIYMSAYRHKYPCVSGYMQTYLHALAHTYRLMHVCLYVSIHTYTSAYLHVYLHA